MSDKPSKQAKQVEKAIRRWLEGDDEAPSMAHVIATSITELEAKVAFMNECNLGEFRARQRLVHECTNLRKKNEKLRKRAEQERNTARAELARLRAEVAELGARWNSMRFALYEDEPPTDFELSFAEVRDLYDLRREVAGRGRDRPLEQGESMMTMPRADDIFNEVCESLSDAATADDWRTVAYRVAERCADVEARAEHAEAERDKAWHERDDAFSLLVECGWVPERGFEHAVEAVRLLKSGRDMVEQEEERKK